MERLTEWKDDKKMLATPKFTGDFGSANILSKLAEYEDLEDKLNGVSVKQVIHGFIKTIENQTNEEYEHGRILTNAEADKWNEYNQLEDQGLLLRLLIKVGDTVYAIGFNNNKPIIYESAILSILITEKEIVFNVKVDEFEINSQLKQSMFGKTVFLTKAEAEQKLKEMERL